MFIYDNKIFYFIPMILSCINRNKKISSYLNKR